jgi:hypothetical protein
MSLVYRPDHPLANQNGMVDREIAGARSSSKSPHVISDIEPFQTQDKVVIGSRQALRAYEQANGVKQVGNDWTGTERPKFWDDHLARTSRR